MFRIYDGREQFFQWDLDRKLIVDDDNITEVHFCNRTAECALPVATYKEGELTLVNVPNLILQESFRMNVYAYDGEYTKHAERFEIIPRSKPDTYVYTETEIKTWDELFERIEQIEQNGVSDEHLAEAIAKYFEENDINVDLTGYATEEFVRQEIAKIEIPEVPEVDLTGYATEQFVKDEIEKIDIPAPVEEVHVGANAPTDENIKIWVDTDAESPVATKEYVQQKVAEAQMGGDVDLSAYYTKTEVDAIVENIELTPGEPGAPGKDGKDGQDYVLTEADKQEIAGMVEVPGADVDLSNYYTKEETRTYVQDSIGSIIMPDMNQYYTKSEVDEKIAAIEIPAGESDIIYDGEYTMTASQPYTVLTAEEAARFKSLKTGDLVDCEVDGYSCTAAAVVVYDGGDIIGFKDDMITVQYSEGTDGTLAFMISGSFNGGKLYNGHVKITKAGAQVDLSNYYTKDETYSKSEVDGLIPDVSGFQTAEEVQSAINSALSAIGIAEEVSF